MNIIYAFSQEISTQGTEFWVGFSSNSNVIEEIKYQEWEASLFITSLKECDVTIENETHQISETYTLSGKQTKKIDLSYDLFAQKNNETAENLGIHITSTDSISVYAVNSQFRSLDIATCIPVNSLGDFYIIQTYDSRTKMPDRNYDFRPAFFQIVATEDNSIVEITPNINTQGGHLANEAFQVTLQKGDAYMVYSTEEEEEGKCFSGTSVRTLNGKKIAIFQGVVCARVPNTALGDADYLLEQAYPVESWGKEFALTNILDRISSIYKITASENNTSIYKNGELLTTLNALESYEFELDESTDKSTYLSASAPVAVYQYIPSISYRLFSNKIGAPSMLWISPLEQRLSNITFTTYSQSQETQSNITTQYINIVIPKEDENDITLDGTTNFAEFSPVEGNPDYLYARVIIKDGSHTVIGKNGAIINVYGQGDCSSYAYSAGSAMKIINQDKIRKYIEVSICEGSSYPFAGETLTEPGIYSDTTTRINEVDSITILTLTKLQKTEKTITDTIKNGTFMFGDQTLTMSGIYKRTETAANGCDSIITLRLNVKKNISESICDGESFNFTGKTITKAGSYSDTISIATGCDSITTLNLTVLPKSEETIKKTILSEETFVFGDKTLSATGIYKRTTTANNGCDSIITLLLSIKKNITASICDGESFSLGENTFTKAGSYSDTISIATGCDSITTLTLTVLPKSEETIEKTILSDETFTFGDKTLSQAGVYKRTTTAENGCDSIITLVLSVKPAPCDTIKESISRTICEGESFPLGENDLTKKGIYKDTVPSFSGCDSIITLTLTVLPKTNSVITDEIHQGETYSKNGFSLPTQDNIGTFSYSLTTDNYLGCDSIITLNLNVVELVDDVKIPTVFTPSNRDETNDIFMEGYEVYIYDRYGNLICKSNNGWCGNYKGETADPGVYIYVLTLKDGRKKKGSIEILKVE